LPSSFYGERCDGIRLYIRELGYYIRTYLGTVVTQGILINEIIVTAIEMPSRVRIEPLH